MEATTTTQALRLPPDLAQDLAALDTRSRSLLTKGRLAAGVSAATAVGAAVAYGWAYAVAPSTALSAVHVPPEVLNTFSSVVGGHPWESASSALTGMLNGWIPRTIAVLAVIVGGAVAAFTGDMKKVVMPIVLAVPMLILPPMMSGLFGDSSGGRESDRTLFERYAENANREALANMLVKADVAPDAYQYVIAQATVAQAHKNDGKLSGDALKALQQQVAAVQFALSHGSKLTFDGKALYALETSATGQARSAQAQRYFADASESASSKRSIASSLLTSALLLGAAGAGLSFFGRGMRRRVERLSALVAPSTDATASVSAPATADAAPAPSYGSRAPSKRRLRDDEDTTPAASSNGSPLVGIAAAGVAAAVIADALSPDAEPAAPGGSASSCSATDDTPSATDCSDSGGYAGGSD